MVANIISCIVRGSVLKLLTDNWSLCIILIEHDRKRINPKMSQENERSGHQFGGATNVSSEHPGHEILKFNVMRSTGRPFKTNVS